MNLRINNEWTYNVDISGLQREETLMFSFYANDSDGYIGENNNNNNNFTILIGDFYAPIITFEKTDNYLNITKLLETDLGLEVNCSVSDRSNLVWVYLYENSTGNFVNRSMNLGLNGMWTYTVYKDWEEKKVGKNLMNIHQIR